MNPFYSQSQHMRSSQMRSLNNRSSLNSSKRKWEQQKQIEDNIMMLKKIHFAEPTIKYSEQLKHQTRAERLRQQIMSGPARQSMMHAARNFILPSGSRLSHRKSSNFYTHEADRQLRQSSSRKKLRHA